ncbi:unnamed protein product [Calypogeia fissa]
MEGQEDKAAGQAPTVPFTHDNDDVTLCKVQGSSSAKGDVRQQQQQPAASTSDDLHPGNHLVISQQQSAPGDSFPSYSRGEQPASTSQSHPGNHLGSQEPAPGDRTLIDPPDGFIEHKSDRGGLVVRSKHQNPPLDRKDTDKDFLRYRKRPRHQYEDAWADTMSRAIQHNIEEELQKLKVHVTSRFEERWISSSTSNKQLEIQLWAETFVKTHIGELIMWLTGSRQTCVTESLFLEQERKRSPAMANIADKMRIETDDFGRLSDRAVTARHQAVHAWSFRTLVVRTKQCSFLFRVLPLLISSLPDQYRISMFEDDILTEIAARQGYHYL